MTNKQRRDTKDGYYFANMPDDAGYVWHNGAKVENYMFANNIPNNEYLIFRIPLGAPATYRSGNQVVEFDYKQCTISIFTEQLIDWFISIFV